MEGEEKAGGHTAKEKITFRCIVFTLRSAYV